MKGLRKPRASSWDVSVAVLMRDSRTLVSSGMAAEDMWVYPSMSEHPVAQLGEDLVPENLPFADDRQRPLRIGAFELTRNAVAVEDRLCQIARRQAVARPDHRLDAACLEAGAARDKVVIERGVRLAGGAQDHRVAVECLRGIAKPAREHPLLRLRGPPRPVAIMI